MRRVACAMRHVAGTCARGNPSQICPPGHRAASQVHEQRASELRALIKTLADQIRPLHETSRRHAAQIEEVSSGINVLAELLRFTNRNRTQTLADSLGAV